MIEATCGGIVLDEIVGEAAELLVHLPEHAKVFITSSNLDFLMDMIYEFEEYLVTDVEFVTPAQILNGHLRGRAGVLLIKDARFLSEGMRHCLYQEAEVLKCDIGNYSIS